MKIIDLLNKIANGEEVSNFKIDGEEYYIENRCVFSKLNGNPISWEIYQGWLNEEIEIIEDNKKIEKISWKEKESLAGFIRNNNDKLDILARRTEKLKKSLNKIIDYINGGKDE